MPDQRLRSPISRAELERRWSLTRAAMKGMGIEALIMQNTSDWVGGYNRWFTDRPANNGYPRTVVFYADRPMTVIEMGAFDAKAEASKGDAVPFGVERMLHTPSFFSVSYTNSYDADLLTAELKASGVKSIGLLTPSILPHVLVTALNELNGVSVVDATNAIDAIKAIKSTEEIAEIKKVATMQDAVFAAVCGFIKPGMRDIDVANFAQAEGNRLGSDQGIYLGSSSPMGVSSRFVGRGMQGRALEKGDHMSLLIEINGPSGMYTEIARTMVLGKADQHLLESFEIVKEAQEYSLSQIKPGALAAEVAAAHDAWMVSHGFGPETRLYAHGQGVDMVERPLIRRDETMKLAEGMCLAVHPGFDDEKVFAVICDNYMVEAIGVSACLHKTEKKIFEL